LRAAERGGLSRSTTASNGTSACENAARSVSFTDATSSWNEALDCTEVRSTSVFTKNPTSSSSAPSTRPAIGAPSGMSVPAPSRCSSAATAACSSMNMLAPVSAASARSAAATSSGMDSSSSAPSKVGWAGRGRSVGSASSGGAPSSVRSQYASCVPARPSPSSFRCHSV
jgi:hypothetical protein